MCITVYAVEIKNEDFVKASQLIEGFKILRTGKTFSVIETTRNQRTALTRNGVWFAVLPHEDEEDR